MLTSYYTASLHVIIICAVKDVYRGHVYIVVIINSIEHNITASLQIISYAVKTGFADTQCPILGQK